MNKLVTPTLQKQTPQRRKHPRVCDAIAMRVEGAGNTNISPLSTTLTHVVNLSAGGLRFTTDQQLVAEDQLRLTMRLGLDLTTVSIQGTVLCVLQKANQAGKKHFCAHIAFNHVGDEAKRLLEQHIDQVRAITQPSSSVYSHEPFSATLAS